MPRIPNTSPATGQALPPHYIHTVSSQFVDQSSRVRIFRGVNLCGSSKTPVGKPSWILDGFWEAVEDADGESFVGRPLQLSKDEIAAMRDAVGQPAPAEQSGQSGQDESFHMDFGSLDEGGGADVHLARLRGWGFTLLRFVFTWEALEHAGPKKYDEGFIAHLITILRKCKAHGFLVFLDPHQDVWSRFTGGSGAPYWTLLACGINPRSLTATQAALLHNEYPTPDEPDPDLFPAMIWGTNYTRLAAQTLFTMFFAGRDYAPKCVIDGMNIQDYLQSHYIGAMTHLAKRIKDAGGLFDECIIGWDSLNEPSEGLVGYADIRKIPGQQALKKGSAPTVAQSLRLAMGFKQEDIEYWDFGSFGPRRNGSVDIDPRGIRLWLERELVDEDENGYNERFGWTRSKEWMLGECPWAMHGVWDPSITESGPSSAASSSGPPPAKPDPDADILFPDYFMYKPSNSPDQASEKVDFLADYFTPHLRAYYDALREYHPELIAFVQPPVFHPPPVEAGEHEVIKGRACFSTHYYDGLTLMTRHWNWFNADALGVLRGQYSSPVFAVKIGEPAIRKSIRQQLGVLKADARILGEFPTCIGEIGTPMELDQKYSYGGADGTGKGKCDYREQVKALDASLQGADGTTGCSVTIWTYCTDGTHKWGDGWNKEDLSLWCADDERRAGSLTGYRVSGSRRLRSLPRAIRYGPKEQATMVVRPVNDDDDSDEQDVQNEEQEQEETSKVEMVGYQVDSATLNLDDLIRGQGPSPTRSNTTSVTFSAPSVSSDTLLASSHLTPYAGPLPFPDFASAPLAFAFLTNGARAWKAFVRAYPLATVGTPTTWEWNIQKAVFEMKVSVGAEDAAFLPPPIDAENEDEDEAQASGAAVPEAAEAATTTFVEQSVPTEIFVPLLHFAKDDVVRKAFGIPTSSASESATPHPTAPLNSEPTAQGSSIPLLDDNSMVSLSVDPSKISLNALEMSTDVGASTSRLGAKTSRVGVGVETEFSMETALDLEVSVSGGRWELEGQVLKWWYPVPAQSAKGGNANVGTSQAQLPQLPRSKSTASLKPAAKTPTIGKDGKVEYTITIKRKGGAIDFKKLGIPESWVGMGPKGDEEKMKKKSESKSKKKGNGRKTDCCGTGCVIA